MRVRLEDPGDSQPAGIGLLEERLDRIGGIDEYSLARALVADQVGRTAEVVVDELAQHHKGEATSATG